MSVDFLNSKCQETTCEKKFGLYDLEDSSPAKIDYINEANWNAKVINDSTKTIMFTAIDYCLELKNAKGDIESTCDCMLTTDSTLYLVELKNRKKNWQAEGLAQIENTISILIREIPEFYGRFYKRKAVVANKKNENPTFYSSNSEQRQHFSSRYRMRVQFDYEIKID